MRASTVLVTEEEIKALFEALSLWDKIDDCIFSAVEIVAKSGPATSYAGATSIYFKHRNPAGGHACTTHSIIGPNGEVLHRCAHDIKAGDVTIAKPTVPRQQSQSWFRRFVLLLRQLSRP